MQKLLISLLAGLAMLGPLAIDTYLPSFPAIGRAFDVGPLLVQQTLSIYLFGFAFLTLFYGTLSDSFGRRPVILVSLVVYVGASVGAALSPNFTWLLACRLIQGLAAGAGWVVGQAIVRDRLSGPPAQRALATIMMVFGLAPAIAPILGGWMQTYFGWQSIFVFLGTFGVLIFTVSYFALPESLPLQARQRFHVGQICVNYWRALRHPQFLAVVLAIGVAFSGFGLYIGSAPYFIMDILGLPETGFGWLFLPLIGGMVAGSAVAARWSTQATPETMIWSGYATMATAALFNISYNYFFVAAIPWAVAPVAVYAFGFSIAAPALTVFALDLLSQNRGMAASLQSFVQLLAFSFVSGLVAPLLFSSALKLAYGVLGGLAISLVFWLLSRPKEGLQKPQENLPVS